MIFERSSVSSTVQPPPQPPPMLRCLSPAARPASPAVSEISVGSPSPPLPRTAFQPLNMKRIRLHNYTAGAEPQPPQPHSVAARRKSCAERTVKSFSIADILGKRDEPGKERDEEEPPREKIPAVPMRDSQIDPVPGPPAVPRLLLDPSLPGKVLGPWEAGPPRHPLVVQPPLLQPAGPPPLPLRPFFPPAALFHYEQRLAWDYQRQLQEHFHVQAQLLRQMSLDPTIIPSEDGSERLSRSSSTASDCCTPEQEADAARRPSGEGDPDSAQRRQRERSQSKADAEESGRQQKSTNAAGDTPLDALFQLSTKNFDEEQDPATLNIFATRPTPKKKRKSRTAFTNHQIFELEKRFLYQKYLSPADRDEIAAGLGLSNAQVITWFQNRRAKLKRDMEELKKDVESVKQLHDQSADISSSSSQHSYRQLLQQYHSRDPTMAASHPNLLPLTLKATMGATATTTAASTIPLTTRGPQHSNKPPVTSQTTAEDKKELKMLKMMTLMYYSSRQ